jgi:hypothetical protein
MSERTSKKPGIADYVAARRKHKDGFLDEINRLIDWKPIEKVLRQKLKRVINAVGNPAYPPLLMFKILLLQGVQQPTEPVRACGPGSLGWHHVQGCPQSGTDARRKSRQSPGQQRSLKSGARLRHSQAWLRLLSSPISRSG